MPRWSQALLTLNHPSGKSTTAALLSHYQMTGDGSAVSVSTSLMHEVKPTKVDL